MKKFFYFITLTFLLGALPALAGPDIGIGPGSSNMAGDVARVGGYGTNVTDTTLSESVGRIIKVALSLVGTIFLALTIYAGILWMTAAGNESKTDSAKNILTAAVIGLVIVISAYAITRLVRTYTTKDVCPAGNCSAAE